MRKALLVVALAFLPALSWGEMGTIWDSRGNYYLYDIPNNNSSNDLNRYRDMYERRLNALRPPQYNYDFASPIINGFIEGQRARQEQEMYELESQRRQQEIELLRAKREAAEREKSIYSDKERLEIEQEAFRRKILAMPYVPETSKSKGMTDQEYRERIFMLSAEKAKARYADYDEVFNNYFWPIVQKDNALLKEWGASIDPAEFGYWKGKELKVLKK